MRISIPQLSIIQKVIAAAVLAAVALFAFNFVSDWWQGNDEVEAEIEGERAGAAVGTAQEALETVGALNEGNDEIDAVVSQAKADIADAETQEEKDRIAMDAACFIDPKYCQGDEPQ